MKLKARVICLTLLTGILYISFKILEPEIQDHPSGKEVVADQDYVESDNYKDADESEIHMEEHESRVQVQHMYNESSKQAIIQRFLKMYDLDWHYKVKDGSDPFQLAASWVSPRSLHPEYAPEIGWILTELATRRIIKADVGYKGTQLKLTLWLEGGQKVIFKPQWFERDHIIAGRPYDGADRHNAEMVAFHLNRLLNYRRTPLVVGRKIDLNTDIVPVAQAGLLKTFFTQDNNTCFYGKCLYCKSKKDGVCAKGSSMEGAVVIFLPPEWNYEKHRHPWQRTYRDDKKARWETDDNYCDLVQNNALYSKGPLLMDIMDACVFDYLMGNADRHHYEVFKDQPDSMLIMWDSGKRIRHKTWERLQQLQDGVLTTVLKRILSKDPLAPLLTEPHYQAMDRRLEHILRTIDHCVQKKGPQHTFVFDKFSAEDL